MELTPRKQKILSTVIEDFIRGGEPVGSKTLLNEMQLGVSSATVRNELADLTNRGFLVQPHTSAGRIPTQQGYRYYIDNIMTVEPLPQNHREYIENKLYECADSPENILKRAAELASGLTNLAAATTTPDGEESRIHKISFVQTGLHTAMVVVIASNGVIKNKLFRCEFVITPKILEIFDNALNKVFSGVKLSSVNLPFVQTTAAKFGELSLFMPGVLMAVKEACDSARTVSVFVSGQTKLLFLPDVDFLRARNVIEFLGNSHDLTLMLKNAPINTAVSIGRENSRIELTSSSVVSTRYSVGSDTSGTLAVVGSLRMDYPKVISILECISDCAGKQIGELVEI